MSPVRLLIYKTLAPAELVTGDGRPLPKRLGWEITREIERLALVQEQLGRAWVAKNPLVMQAAFFR